MAEVFGVAAGVVGVASLAIQLADSVKKLKEFCDSVKNVPTEVKETIEEIELLSSVLTTLDGSITPGATNQQDLKKCVDLCRRGIEQISVFAKAFEDRLLSGKRSAAIKVVFRMEKMKIPMERLERGKATLLLAHQMYQSIIQRQTMQDIIAGQALILQQTQTVNVVAPCSQAAASDTRTCDANDRRSRRTGAASYEIRVSLPARFSGRVWSLAMEQAICGWSFHMREYRFLPRDHQARDLCAVGDSPRLQGLLDRKEISPYDHVEGIGSLLDVSVQCDQERGIVD